MRQAQDSMSYYRLMGLYGKTFFKGGKTKRVNMWSA